MTKLALLAAGGLFVLLGLFHGYLTARSMRQRGALMLASDDLRLSMIAGRTRADPSMTIWDAWLGMNWSHSLGLAMFGTAAILFGSELHPLYLSTPLPALVLVGLGLAYVGLALRFWFWAPVAGTILATLLLSIALVLCFVA